VKKEQNGKESLRRLKPTVGCNPSKRKRRIILCDASSLVDSLAAHIRSPAACKFPIKNSPLRGISNDSSRKENESIV
jgi:hypothetical protein